MIPLWIVIPLALAGGLIATFFHIPAGPMIGALIAVGAANLILGRASQVPKQINFAGRALLGTVIGSSIDRHTLELLGNAIAPTIGLAVTLLLGSILIAFIMMRLAKLDRATAICSYMPGGMGEMTAVAHDLGADMRVVAALHVMRLILILVIVPLTVAIVASHG